MNNLVEHIGNILPPFENKETVIIDNQTTEDIINGLKKWHKKYASHYDKIVTLFSNRNISAKEFLKNIFYFLKDSYYNVEDVENQTLRSPSAIAETKNAQGIDCKNYSLFIGGLIDASNRLGLYNIPFVYRFASYDFLDKEPKHVFIVAYPNSKKEIWVDCVLDDFNQRLQPYYLIDKNFSNMALKGLSGIGEAPNNQTPGNDFWGNLQTGGEGLYNKDGLNIDAGDAAGTALDAAGTAFGIPPGVLSSVFDQIGGLFNSGASSNLDFRKKLLMDGKPEAPFDFADGSWGDVIGNFVDDYSYPMSANYLIKDGPNAGYNAKMRYDYIFDHFKPVEWNQVIAKLSASSEKNHWGNPKNLLYENLMPNWIKANRPDAWSAVVLNAQHQTATGTGAGAGAGITNTPGKKDDGGGNGLLIGGALLLAAKLLL